MYLQRIHANRAISSMGFSKLTATQAPMSGKAIYLRANWV